MKIILLVLMLLPVFLCRSQDVRIALSAKGARMTVLLDDNNIGKTFNLKKTNVAATDYFKAAVINEQIDTSWCRNFTIHDASDSIIASLKNISNNTYSISLKELIPKLRSGGQYYLYTIALPADPKRQMLVKVIRKLICKIAVKN